MKRDLFEDITCCFHVAIAPIHVQDRKSPIYDKLHKICWLVDDVYVSFKNMWASNQQVTINDSMVLYKGKYSPICQYMPNKPVRFGLKIWAIVDALSKYIWNFQIYCGKMGNSHDDGAESEQSDDDATTPDGGPK